MKAWTLALLVALAPALAHAQEAGADPAFIKARVEALYQEGVTLYQANRFREALPKFEAAQALFPDPSLIYNIGRCHEGLGEVEIAEARYRALVADPAAPAEVKAKGEARLAAIEAERAAKAAPVPVPVEAPEPAPEEGMLPWVIIGSGGAAIAAGVVFITLGVADHEELDRYQRKTGPGITDKKARELDEAGATKKTSGGALLGLGATGVGVGVYLLLTGQEEATAGPIVGPNHIGFGGTF